jgi:hypothetical protein
MNEVDLFAELWGDNKQPNEYVFQPQAIEDDQVSRCRPIGWCCDNAARLVAQCNKPIFKVELLEDVDSSIINDAIIVHVLSLSGK